MKDLKRSPHLLILIIGLAMATAIISSVFHVRWVVAQSSFKYYTDITITNPTATAYTTRVSFPINPLALVSGAYIKANATDTELYQGASIIPLMANSLASSAANWYTGIISLPAFSVQSYRLYLGDPTYTRDQPLVSLNTDMVTIAHAANMNISNNLSIWAEPYIYTAPATTQYLYTVPEQYELSVTATGNYKFTVYSSTLSTVTWLGLPIGAGFYNTCSTSSGVNWADNRTSNGNTSYTSQVIGGGNCSDTFAIPVPNIPTWATITGVAVYAEGEYTGGVAGPTVETRVRLGGVDGISGVHALTAVYASYNDSHARPGGGNWTLTDFQTLEIGYRETSGAFGEARNTYTYVSITWQEPLQTTVLAPYALGAHQYISATYDNTARIYVNNNLINSSVLTLPLNPSNNTAYWQFSGVNYDLKIGGTSVASPTWISAYDFSPSNIYLIPSSNTIYTVFDITSSNHASVTFTGNPHTSITAILSGLTPTGVSSAGIGATPSAPEVVSTIAAVNMFATSAVNINAFGYDIVSAMSGTSGYSVKAIYMVLLTFLAVGLFIVSYVVFNSLMFAAFPTGAVIVLGSVWNIYNWAILALYIVIAGGMMILEARQTI